MKTVDAGTGEEVSRSDLVKGFTIAKDQYVLLDKEDLDAVKLRSTRIIDIEAFVPARSIDRLYWDVPYHLMPSGKTGIETFAVIRTCWKSPRRSSISRRANSIRRSSCATSSTGFRCTRISARGQASSTVSCGAAAAPEGSRRDARRALTAIAQFPYRSAARAFDGSFLVRM